MIVLNQLNPFFQISFNPCVNILVKKKNSVMFSFWPLCLWKRKFSVAQEKNEIHIYFWFGIEKITHKEGLLKHLPLLNQSHAGILKFSQGFSEI